MTEKTDRTDKVKHREHRAHREMLRQGKACHLMRDYLAHFANPLRLQILCELTDQEATVTDLVEATGARQPAVSQQLNHLRMSGIVSRSRDGNRSVYKLEDDIARDMMDFIYSIADRLLARQNRGCGEQS